MRLIAKVVRISHAKFHCNRLTTVQGVQDYASLIFWATVVCHWITVGVSRVATYARSCNMAFAPRNICLMLFNIIAFPFPKLL